MTPELAVANTEKESGIHEKEGVVVFKMFNKVSMEEAKNIVRQIIHFEKQDSQGHAILYRGAQNDVDSLIDISENYWSNPPSCDKLMTERSSIPTYHFLSVHFLSIYQYLLVVHWMMVLAQYLISHNPQLSTKKH